jgi:hypothetical protein
VAKFQERVNLRLSSAALGPYVRLAGLITAIGFPISATQLIRAVIEAQLPQTELLCSYAEAALRGDKAAAHEVFDRVLSWNQGTIDAVRAAEDATVAAVTA